MMKENSLIKISVDTLGSETSIANIIKGLNNSFLRNDDYFFRLWFYKNISLINYLILKKLHLNMIFGIVEKKKMIFLFY